MTKLSPNEKDLLQRIEEKEELRLLFFRKAKGLKWFEELKKRDYFNPAQNPKPAQSKEEGSVYIPFWPAVDYLVKTAPELSKNENIDYAKKFLEIIVAITNYAKDHNFSNYHTWWQFAEIISRIPSEVISLDCVAVVDYWLDDKYERGLVAEEIGKKWLPKLFEANDAHSLKLAFQLLTFLYKVVFVERKYGEKPKRELTLRFDYYHAQKITESTAYLAGTKLGREAALFFDSQLKFVLHEINNDSWSAIWQPAIEEHEQNKHRDDAENIIVKAYRDILEGYIKIKPEEAIEYIAAMLKEKYTTIHRIAIYVISRNYNLCIKLADTLLTKKYLGDNYRHEMWHMLNGNYFQFSQIQKQKVITLIFKITRTDNDGNIQEGSTAYKRAIWLAAIKNHGGKENKLYKENIKIAKAEPDHPDFSSYMSMGWGGHGSPIPIDELQALPIEKLVTVLKDYKDPGIFGEPGIEGLVKIFKQIIKTKPLQFYNHFTKFVELDLAYIYEIIEAYRDLWVEKNQLPWDDIWAYLLDFCLTVINQERFWEQENSKQERHFIGNRYWIVSSIGRLLESGTKSDDHSFGEELLLKAEKILVLLLNKEEGNKYEINSDAVSIAINSPRGHCIEALINLTLRSCRLADKKNKKNHADVWAHFKPLYDAELTLADLEKPQYEFVTLVTNYLPNFLYMSKDWVSDNLSRIFDKSHYLKWLCAMQGYSYIGTVYEVIYKYLKDNGDLKKALDDKNVKKQVEDRIIQNITVAYIHGFEKFSDQNSLIKLLVSRKDYNELRQLIWFMWTLRKKGDQKLKKKVLKLWPKILATIDFDTNDGRRLASQLCHWASFIEQVDSESMSLLLAIAPYAEEEYNAPFLLESIAYISKTQAFEAHIIWMKMLEGTGFDYPEEAVRESLVNILNLGLEGERKTKEIVSEYLKKGIVRPATLLQEIKKGKGE